MVKHLLSALVVFAATASDAAPVSDQLTSEMTRSWVEVDAANFNAQTQAAALKKCSDALLNTWDSTDKIRLDRLPNVDLMKGDMSIVASQFGHIMVELHNGTGKYAQDRYIPHVMHWVEMFPQNGRLIGKYVRLSMEYKWMFDDQWTVVDTPDSGDEVYFGLMPVRLASGADGRILIDSLNPVSGAPFPTSRSYLGCPKG